MQRRSARQSGSSTSSPQSDNGGSGDDHDPCLLDPYYFDDLPATRTRSHDSGLVSVPPSSPPLPDDRHRGQQRRRSDDPKMRRFHERTQSSSSSSSSTETSGLPLSQLQRAAALMDPESLNRARRSTATRGSVQRRRLRSSLARHQHCAASLFGSERAVRTLMMALLVASLVSVMFLACLVPTPHPMIMDEESRIMWNLGGGRSFGRNNGTALQGRDSVCVVLPATALSPRGASALAVPLPGNESISGTDDGGEDDDDDRRGPDYGGLKMEFFEEPGVSRAIYHDPSLDETKKDRKPQQEERVDVYYSFDDDERRNPYRSRKGKEGQRCRRTHFHRRRPINCNAMYEMDFWNIVASGNQKYLGGGSYRDVHLIDIEGDGKFVYKTSGPEANYRFDDYEFIRMDCVVLELLSSRPSIVNSYAYCGLDQIGEAMMNGDFDSLAWPIGGRKKVTLRDADNLDPRNSLTPDDKLRFALEMAEALAELHGFYGGVLVHDDVQLSQFLLTEDGKHIRLNDFNRAEFMLWNEEKGEYCKYQNNPGHGDWRAPEEYFDDPLDEKIDVFSLGNNLYAMLTGLSPFYDTLKSKDAVERVKRGEKPYIDPRWRNHSFAEGKIVDLIERCQPFKAEDRIDIFETVRFLRDAIQENERRKRRKQH